MSLSLFHLFLCEFRKSWSFQFHHKITNRPKQKNTHTHKFKKRTVILQITMIHQTKQSKPSNHCNKIILENKHNRKKQRKHSTIGVKAVFLASLASVLAASHIPTVCGYAAFSRPNHSLRYKNLDVEEDASQTTRQQSVSQQVPQYHISNVFYTWWTASKSKRAKREAEAYAALHGKDEEQIILDNYLESIDRRYKRLHQREKERGSDGVSNAWQWLMSGQMDSSISDEQRRKEDALYVLGLANLASKSLLEKHQLPVPKSKLTKKAVIDIDAISNSSNGECVTVPHIQKTIQKRIVTLPTFLKGYIQNSGERITRSFTPVFDFASSLSGGKYNIQLASLFLAAIVGGVSSILRPLMSAYVK